MRKKSELKNVLKALKLQKVRLLDYGWNKKDYRKIISAEYYYTDYLLKHGYLPTLEHTEPDVKYCYEWLRCNGNEDYYEDILIELMGSLNKIGLLNPILLLFVHRTTFTI